jgi:hypothetical protein
MVKEIGDEQQSATGIWIHVIARRQKTAVFPSSADEAIPLYQEEDCFAPEYALSATKASSQ